MGGTPKKKKKCIRQHSEHVVSFVVITQSFFLYELALPAGETSERRFLKKRFFIGKTFFFKENAANRSDVFLFSTLFYHL